MHPTGTRRGLAAANGLRYLLDMTNANSIRLQTKHIRNGKTMSLRNLITVKVVRFVGILQGQPAYYVVTPSGYADIAFAGELA